MMKILKKAVIRRLIIVGLFIILIFNSAEAAWISSKAYVAQWLIHNAWQQGSAQKPWPWADTHTVAKLTMPSQQIQQYVLAGTDGSSLAFGPGWQRASAEFGKGTSLIAGHNDTHFAFLEHVKVGETLQITTLKGAMFNYRIIESTVVDSEKDPLWIDEDEHALLLVTCYPFTQAGSESTKRLLVKAKPI